MMKLIRSAFARGILTLSRLILIGLIVSCSNAKDIQDNESAPDLFKAYVYECNNFSFIAKFDAEKVWLFLLDKTISLEKQVSASGTLYSDGNLVFWGKGEQARLEIDQTIYTDCKNNPARAVWETAKLHGVDFRATGNEPGWILEIKEYGKTIFITGYGQRKYTFKTSHSVVDYVAKRTIYKSQSNEHTLEIFLESKSCFDSMSGEEFETTVFVGMDGLGYHGCGKALH
jgi:membrane-bound inhibitor of C-type lysozyme